MNKLLHSLGTASGLLGAIICLVSGLTRVSGSFYLGGYAATTLFMAGVGLMVFACLLKLEALAAERRIN
jgi:hypothetical protein